MPLTHRERFERRRLMAEAALAGKATSEVARDFGVNYMTARNAFDEFGVRWIAVREPNFVLPVWPEPPPRNEPNIHHHSSRVDWEVVDWNLRDVDICKMIGVSRERVRQVRNKYDKGISKFKGMQKEGIALNNWLEANAATVSGLTATQIAKEFGIFDICSIRNYCRRLGINVSPSKIPITRESLESMVEKRPIQEGMSDCWIWTKTKVSVKPPYPRYRGRHVHDQVYEVFHGPKPSGAYIIRSCGQQSCVNPEHLFAGSASDAMQLRGKRNPRWYLPVNPSSERSPRLPRKVDPSVSVSLCKKSYVNSKGFRAIVRVNLPLCEALGWKPVTRILATWGESSVTLNENEGGQSFRIASGQFSTSRLPKCVMKAPHDATRVSYTIESPGVCRIELPGWFYAVNGRSPTESPNPSI